MTVLDYTDTFNKVKYHGVTYAVDFFLNFFVLGTDGEWHLISARHIPTEVVEVFRSLW